MKILVFQSVINLNNVKKVEDVKTNHSYSNLFSSSDDRSDWNKEMNDQTSSLIVCDGSINSLGTTIAVSENDEVSIHHLITSGVG